MSDPHAPLPDGARLETVAVHAGESRIAGALVTPVFQSSTFEHGGAHGDRPDYHAVRYLRLSNSPNHVALHAKLAALEGAEAGLVTASGMAAIATTLLTLLKPGDHLLTQDCLYGGTHDLLAQDLAALGITHTPVDARAPESWAAALRPTTRAFYVEAITNPLCQVGALPEVAAFARAHGLTSLIDATFASPVNLRPIRLGFDVVLHSATKYLNGHSDLVAGAVLGRAELVGAVKRKLDHLGGSLDPHACFLLQRGLKTLALRVRHQSASALAIARFLAGRAEVERVHYPLLEGSPDLARARAFLAGGGGVLSFELRGGLVAAERLVARLRLPISAPSLGGPETLITRPATTSHAGLAPAERHRLGIPDGLLRVSIGLEATEDLLADFAQALSA